MNLLPSQYVWNRYARTHLRNGAVPVAVVVHVFMYLAKETVGQLLKTALITSSLAQSSDVYTLHVACFFVSQIMEELANNGVNIYRFPVDDETVAEMNAGMNVSTVRFVVCWLVFCFFVVVFFLVGEGGWGWGMEWGVWLFGCSMYNVPRGIFIVLGMTSFFIIFKTKKEPATTGITKIN